MKVILLKDVPKVGRKFEVKDVSDGYGINFLIPRGLAEKATPQALVALKQQIDSATSAEKIQQELLHKNFDSLKQSEIKIKRPANEEGHLFAGVKAEDIKTAVETQLGVVLPKDFIELEHPLKTTGEHSIKVKSGEHKANIKIIIERE
jgi:large subunit ribosomal protein L9